MSLCGGIENGTGPTDEEFERNVIEYTEVIEARPQRSLLSRARVVLCCAAVC